MRIIGGKYRNRKIIIPDLKITRPTIDRVRESIFNILQTKIQGKCVLDVFSGSGAFALESASRGAAKVRANDISLKSTDLIKQTIATIGANNIDVFNMDYVAFLHKAATVKWDIVFLDPPYSENKYYTESLKILMDKKGLNANALIVCEHSKNITFDIPKGYAIFKRKKYGNISITILSII